MRLSGHDVGGRQCAASLAGAEVQLPRFDLLCPPSATRGSARREAKSKSNLRSFPGSLWRFAVVQQVNMVALASPGIAAGTFVQLGLRPPPPVHPGPAEKASRYSSELRLCFDSRKNRGLYERFQPAVSAAGWFI